MLCCCVAGYGMDSIGNIRITQDQQQQFVNQKRNGVYLLNINLNGTPMTFNEFKNICELPGNVTPLNLNV